MNPSISGVYFLIKNGTVVYVGESSDIYRRIPEHRRGMKCHGNLKQDFDEWEYIAINNGASRRRAERLLIQMLRPEWNIAEIKTKSILPAEVAEEDKISPLFIPEREMRTELEYISIPELSKLFGIPSSYFTNLVKAIPEDETIYKRFGWMPYYFKRSWIAENIEAIGALSAITHSEKGARSK